MLDMRNPTVQAIVDARVSLLFDDPWYGNIATRCVISFDEEETQLQVTYRNMLVNPSYVKSLPREALVERVRAAVNDLVLRVHETPRDADDAQPRVEFVNAMIAARDAVGVERTPAIALACLNRLGL